MQSSAGARGRSADDRLDAVFHALGDRTRRALLARLAERPAKITELAKPFDISLPAVSRHIRVLESAGLVARTVDGRVHECSLAAAPLKTAEAWLMHYRQFWQDKLAALEHYIDGERGLGRPGAARARHGR
jgi:DNA-binding transcriptional ArsR family regulator